MKRNLFVALLVALFLTSASFAQQPGGATGTPTTANQFRPTATPATPPCPYSRMFMNLSSQMALVDCTGVVTLVSSGGGGGSGTVTTVSIGNLSPLFTAGVTNPTTTPAIAFALSNAGANTYFGNSTGSTGAPSYTNAGALTNVNDTNVTLTLGGNPATSLLRAVSITAGWTGTLAASRGGTGLSTPTNNGVIVGDGSVWAASVIPSCSNATTSKLLYDNTTRTFTCGVDQTSGGGSGITSLNSQTGGTQTFGNDTNVTVVSASNVHTITWAGTLAAGRLNSNVVQSVVNDTNVTGSISAQALTLAWTGTLAKTRQHADTVYSTGGTADRISFFTGSKDILSDNALVWDNTNKRLGIGTTSPGLPLDVVANGSALAQQWRETGAGTARIQMQIPSSFGQFGTSSNHDFSLMTNGIQRVNVEATGGTVFGSIVPATGTVMVNAIANTDVSIVGNNASGSTTDILKLQVGGSNRFRLLSTGEFVAGLVSTVTGKLSMANAAGSTITSISAGNAASTLNFIWPVLDPTAGQVLSAAAPSGGNVVLSWIANGGGGGGSGDVVGPGSATDNAVARFDTTTGKLIQNSVVTIADTSGNMAGVGTLNTHTIPGGTDTFEMLGAAQTVTGIKTYGDGILKATSPWITTGLDDSAGNRMVGFTATASSVNYFNLTNSATATKPLNILEMMGSDSNVSLHIKTKTDTYPNMGQVYFNVSGRYDRPAISFWDSTFGYLSQYGIGVKAGGSYLSVYGQNLKLGTREDVSGLINMSGDARFVWHDTNSAAEDCPPCTAVGFNKASRFVVGLIGPPTTPDDTHPNGATWRAIPNTPATITATTNNYNPSIPSYFQRWSTDASRQITGLTFAVTQVSGQVHKIVNVGAEDIVLVNETSGTGSTAANRFKTSDGNNLTLTPGQCADAIYDGTDSRWRVHACEGVGGGGGGGADTALSNLASVAINTSLLPASDNTIDLGSSAKRFASLYLVGSIKDGSGNNLTTFSPNGSAVNYLNISNGATGFGPVLSAIGTDSNIRLSLQSKGAEDVRVLYSDSSTNTTDTVFSMVRNSSGTAANNIGAANNFYLQTSTTPTTLAGGFGVQWVTATHASRVSRMFFNTVDASQVFGERMGLDHNGIRLPEISSAATPAANSVYVYAKDNGSGVSKLYYKGDDGTEVGPLAAGGGGGSTNPTSTIVPYNNAGTFADTNLAFASPTFTQTITSIGTTPSEGLVFTNTTAAGAGAQQNSPSVRFSARGWRTTSTAASQVVDWRMDLRPVENAASPDNRLVFSPQVNGGGYSERVVFGVSNGSTHYVQILPNAGEAGWAGLTIGQNYGTIATPVVAGLWESGGSILGLRVPNGATTGQIALYGQVTVLSGNCYRFSNNSTSVGSGAADTFMCRGGAAATLQIGQTLTGVANATTPSAQVVTATSARAGTDSNLVGSSVTYQSGLGTGNAAASTLTLRSSVATSSGTGAHTYATGLVINAGTAVLTNYTVATLPSASASGMQGAMAFVTDATSTTTYTTVAGGGSNKVLVISDGTNWIIH